MTIDEVSESCGVSAEKLKHYRELGLIPSCGEEWRKRLGLISSLAKAGVSAEKIVENPVLLDESAGTLEERVRIMKKERFRQLDDLHERQQSLDCLDCIIRDIKKNGGPISR